MNIKCHKCGSENIHIDKKGFSGTKAVAGAVLTGPVGALAGTHNSNKIICTCVDCGFSWDNVKFNKEIKSNEVQVQLKSFKDNKKRFYYYYENNDPQRAFQHLSKFEGAATKTDLDKYYKKWKSDDRLKNILSVAVFFAVPLFFFLLVKACS